MKKSYTKNLYDLGDFQEFEQLQQSGREQRKKRRSSFNKKENANSKTKKPEEINNFQQWLDGINNNNPYFVREFEQFQNFPKLLSELTITYNQFDKASIFIQELIYSYKYNSFSNSILYLNEIFNSAWFNIQLFERCINLVDQAKYIKYLLQEMEKIHNLISPTLNLATNSLKISSISSIFHMQKIIENSYPECQFTHLFNQYDKLLLYLYNTARQNEFRETPIYPVPLEFNNFYPKDQQLFGQIVKIDQTKDDLESYLDYHFNILREDYIRDLRRAISSLNESGFYKIDKEVVKNVDIYQNIELVSVGMNNFEVILGISVQQFTLDGRKQKLIDWCRSKKLSQGSLICLTNLECFPLIFGVITFRTDKQNQYNNCKEKHKKKIFLEFKFIDPKQLIMPFLNLLSQETILIQYEGLVEPILYYLESLKSKYELPFFEIIVGNSKQIAMPKHIIKKSVYVLDFSGHSSYERGYQVDLSTNQLPNIPSTLDQSQLNAIKVMLVNNVALVQGPPGTGKTYCGALAVRALYYNIKKKNYPILIVCYTNHALDQFLEHIIKFVPTKDVARLGGSCKNPALQECVFRCKTSTFNLFEWNEFKLVKAKLQKILERMLNYNYKPDSKLLKKYWPSLYNKIIQCFMYNNDLVEENFNEEHRNYFVNCWLQNEIPKEKNVGYRQYFNGMNRYFKDSELTSNFQNRKLFSKQFYQDQEGNQKNQDGSDEELDDYLDSEDEATYAGFTKQMAKNDELEINKAIHNFNNNQQNKNQLHFNFEGIDILKAMLDSSGSNPWCMSAHDIFEVRYYIKSLAYQTDSLKYDNTLKKFQEMSQKLKKIYDDNEINILNEKKIVGVTVTGVAKQVNKLSQLNAKIMVIEEAAEVLESHVVSILTKNLDHLILIGDHQQLRPTLKCYELEKKFEANISLFERLVKKQIPVAVLKQQRRMKTKFADFIRQIYGNSYEDHQDINKLNKIEINGLGTDLLFFNHKWLEAQDEKSKINYQEAEMIFRMVQYLLKTGYKEEQISVLSLYLKQAQSLKRKFINLKQFQVKVQTVDNYQGEENDIVIISLVRNNTFNKLGHISIENRINVALSRARIGMYVFGNFDFVAKASGQGSMWHKILYLAKQKQCLQDFIPLKCLPHGNIRNIYKPDEWEIFGAGNCNQKCKKIFQNCNHQCEKQCHRDDHSAENCPFKCDRTIDCGHQCQLQCKEKCVCQEKVQITLPCGHNDVVLCGTDPNTYICNKQCQVNFVKCGHTQQYLCYERAKYKNTCYEPCRKALNCGHTCNKKCCENCLPCVEPCKKGELKCGHPSVCEKLCSQPCDPCIQIVKRKFECGHIYKLKCAQSEKIIQQKIHCEKPCIKIRDCGHNSECFNMCYEPCSPCEEMVEVQLQCGHEASLRCFERNTQFTCLNKCIKPRKCNHSYPCSQRCYEPCSPCQEIVNYQLECGHYQEFVCHSLQSDVARFRCQQKCQKSRPCGHSQACLNICSSNYCTPCQETINIKLNCDHLYETICYKKSKDLISIQCLEECSRERQCGHIYPCQKKCFERCSPCLQKITHKFKCGHKKQLACDTYEKQVYNYKCQEKCEKRRPCGHNYPCQNVCSNSICTPCKADVEVILDCGHKNMKPCYQDIKSVKCSAPCEKIRDCGHLIQCNKLCSEKCSPCSQLVVKQLNCGHGLAVECANFSYKVICKQPCAKQRQCGHELPCQNLCYQQCSPCVTTYLEKASCGHEVTVQCFQANEDLQAYRCYKNCIKPRKCGHDYPCNNICRLNKECTPCLTLIQHKNICGHVAKIQCYQKTLLQSVLCDQPCQKSRKCGHNDVCKNKCSQLCSPCQTQIKTTLPCLHEAIVNCCQNIPSLLKEIKCREPCSKTSPCVHDQKCSKLCYEPCDPCKFSKKKVFPCGHSVTYCTQNLKNSICRQQCERKRLCQHVCEKLCFQDCGVCETEVVQEYDSCNHSIKIPCYQRRNHEKCRTTVSKLLKCGMHFGDVECHMQYDFKQDCKQCGCQIQ